jgi:hypothetical protein
MRRGVLGKIGSSKEVLIKHISKLLIFLAAPKIAEKKTG